jgi:hypothetical protein
MTTRQGRCEQWSRLVELQQKSGQSVRVFCKQQALSEPSFYSWRQRLRNERPVSFALVDTASAASAAGAAIEVILTSGDRLQVPRDAAALRMVLSVLRERP